MTLIPRERKLRMSIGREVRLKNIFSNPSGNLFGVAIDHFCWIWQCGAWRLG